MARSYRDLLVWQKDVPVEKGGNLRRLPSSPRDRDDSPWESSNIFSAKRGDHSWNWKPNSISLQTLVTSIASPSKAYRMSRAKF